MKAWHVYKHKNGKDAGILPIKVDGEKVRFVWVNLVSQKLQILSDFIDDIFPAELQANWNDLGPYDTFDIEDNSEEESFRQTGKN